MYLGGVGRTLSEPPAALFRIRIGVVVFGGRKVALKKSSHHISGIFCKIFPLRLDTLDRTVEALDTESN